MTEIYDRASAPTREQILSQARQSSATKPATTTRPAVRVPSMFDKINAARKQGYSIEDLAEAAGVPAGLLQREYIKLNREATRTFPYGHPGGKS